MTTEGNQYDQNRGQESYGQTGYGREGGVHGGQPGYGGEGGGYGEPQGYGPGYGGAPPAPRNGLGTTALVLGILAILSAWIPVFGVVGIILAIVAIILGFIGRGRVKRGQATNGGAALTGAILGIIALLLGLAVQIVVTIAGVSFFQSGVGQSAVQCIRDQQQSGADQATAQQVCAQQIQQQIQQQNGQ